MTIPDPKETVYIEDKIKVPLGKPIPSGLTTACSHNELIIYDVNQVNIRYLLVMNFKHKH